VLQTYDYMEEIGVRDLKARLSEVLRAVEGGKRVRVTSRGRPVAEIVPPGLVDLETRLDILEAAGLLTRAKKPPPKTAPPLSEPRGGQTASEWIIAQRERRR